MLSTFGVAVFGRMPPVLHHLFTFVSGLLLLAALRVAYYSITFVNGVPHGPYFGADGFNGANAQATGDAG